MPKGVYKRTEEYRIKLRELKVGKPRRGDPTRWKHSEETKRKLSIMHKRLGTKPPSVKGLHWKNHKGFGDAVRKRNLGKIRLRGEKSPLWKGGKPKCLSCGRQLSSIYSKRCKSCSRKGELSPIWKGGYKERRKRYVGKNRDKINFWRKQYDIRKFSSGYHTLGDWKLLKKQYGFTCPCCHKIEPEIKLTEDHIIPLSRGGSNFIENIQPLCKSCNSRKHIKTIRY